MRNVKRTAGRWAIAGGMAVAAVVASLVLACAGVPGGGSAPVPGKSRVRPYEPVKVYDRDDFKKQFLGATLTDVRATLGAPDEADLGSWSWTYHRRTRNDRGSIDSRVVLQHKDDRVFHINFHD